MRMVVVFSIVAVPNKATFSIELRHRVKLREKNIRVIWVER